MKERAPRRRYEIRVRGALSERLLSAFPGVTAKVRNGITVLVARFPDQSGVYGVIERLESLGLELVGVSSRADESSRTDDDHSSRSPRG